MTDTVRVAVPFASDRPAAYPLADQHAALVAAGARSTAMPSLAAKALGRLPRALPGAVRRGGPVVLGLMGLRRNHYAAWASHTRVVPWCFDVWEPDLATWRDLFARHPPAMVLATSSQGATALAEFVPVVHHLPEGAGITGFDPSRPLGSRSIDVLEMGRRLEPWHRAVAPTLERAGARHVFQASPASLIFAGRAELEAGLGDAKISVCFPSSMTNPERSGSFETLTLRYLESMAAGCIVLGHAPRELIDLFGYDPCVTADLADPGGQLEAILRDPEAYAGLVSRNLERLAQVGTWDVRARDALALVRRHL